MSNAEWRRIVADSLGWEQAHATLENAVKGLSIDDRGKRPERYPHSPWELLEHIRITQADLLDFCTNSTYKEHLEWPHDYWPRSISPPNGDAWTESLRAIQSDRQALARFTTETSQELTARIPWGTGQTFLRTVLVAVDHTSYHVGQIIAVRRLLGVWPST
jgi:uncharacterized damage-inducible protein DinB